MGIYPGQKVTPEKLARANELRAEMTEAEALLWAELRANRLGMHFWRQQIIAGFIVDFYCHAAAMVIEVDGAVHSDATQRADDERRAGILQKMGIRVLRVHNSEVESDMPAVLARIKGLIDS